ncbi:MULTISPECIES: CpsD/CapB family tyrosine-protein kinase [Aneurinibacillus]|uniref:non-specific protein-tyrosine kinase n=1 Tax=Aneurinibacillus thermoaerophilus TaxID=143495 RepID=A0A1G8A0J8_ANETH|nr:MULTISPECIES: CpsD/CapB family tyrosine-protein kinase [Aneurinibacillus]AMA71668.1 capsular biosynthesis protein [Aneurinibacillus sp. XH2]MED0676117.1 CpsD/CapB family tyrosine-protein kinase [Aneurinibacillus thermoaerophilus]MED0680783.1 CpsD/CapB family tyrosine-protein kinase [Aneurinibacillus thermoaerophilus]MED0738382.1 CpsD/CapB family tyrosine-protein kinase [Aneurinibacillus thermoaerophilus]MED0757654.1 CpsD/CapB family tyrosine-protein kinase [Aneurinibacillus thermoaerophilus
MNTAIDKKRYEKLIAYWNPKSQIAEAYRTLRTNIQFASVDEEIKTILITSTGPAEGKSTTATNLAVVMAQAAKRTLYIDADLRKPAGHHIFQVPNRRGLTTYLAGQIQLRDAVQETGIENLAIMTAGPIPPNPAELLGSKKMKLALKELHSQFEAIILDTPPVIAVADAAILSRLVDGCILVVNAGKTNRDLAARAKQQLEHTNARLLGVVLNNKQIKHNNYYYYYKN